MESPETMQGPEAIGHLIINLCSMTKERTEEEEREEEAEPEPVYKAPPTPLPWFCHYLNHPL
jgi:hypothetical protein